MSRFESRRDEALYHIAFGAEDNIRVGDLTAWGGVYIGIGQVTAAEHADVLETYGVGAEQVPADTFWIIREDASGCVTIYEHGDEDGYRAALDQARAEFEARR